MIYDKDIAVKMASHLLEVQAVKLSPQNPFTWTSGWKSPIYCDNRITLSFPPIRDFIKINFAKILHDKFSGTELIAGVATAGIAHGALLADVLEKPFCYVRSSAKSHGLQNQIEGKADGGQKVVVVEDLISTGGSSLHAVEALRNVNCDVKGLVAIFTYGFIISEQKFTEQNCSYFTLTDYETLLKVAVEKKFIQQDQIELLSAWRMKPDTWGK
jgi:orotate phosphoribosyltransferase